MTEDLEDEEPWFESIGQTVDMQLSFHNQDYKVKMPLITSPSDSTLPCLAAVLLQTGKAIDCEDAIKNISYHIPAVEKPSQQYYVFVQKSKLAQKQ